MDLCGHVCVDVCACVRLWTRTRECVCGDVCTRVCVGYVDTIVRVDMCVWMCVDVYEWTRACRWVRVDMCVWTCVWTCGCVDVYGHVCVDVCVCGHIHLLVTKQRTSRGKEVRLVDERGVHPSRTGS